MTTEPFVDQAELLRRLADSFRRFDVLLDEALAFDVEQAGVAGVWSVKDIVAHLIAHEQRALEEIAAAKAGWRLEINHAEMDSFNAGAVFACRIMPYALVRNQWHRSYQRAVARVRSLTDADFDPNGEVVRWLDDSIDGALANNTYAHYDFHGEQIAAWIANQRL